MAEQKQEKLCPLISGVNVFKVKSHLGSEQLAKEVTVSPCIKGQCIMYYLEKCMITDFLKYSILHRTEDITKAEGTN